MSPDGRGVCVFVGGLNQYIKKEDIEMEFKRFGKVSNVWLALNPPGYGFLEFETMDEAENAIKQMNGADVQGCKIKVELSRRQERVLDILEQRENAVLDIIAVRKTYCSEIPQIHSKTYRQQLLNLKNMRIRDEQLDLSNKLILQCKCIYKNTKNITQQFLHSRKDFNVAEVKDQATVVLNEINDLKFIIKEFAEEKKEHEIDEEGYCS